MKETNKKPYLTREWWDERLRNACALAFIPMVVVCVVFTLITIFVKSGFLAGLGVTLLIMGTGGGWLAKKGY